MEDFIVQLQKNIKKTSKEKESKSNRYRGLLYHIITSNPEVKHIERCNNEGDIKFEVPLRSLGISFDTLSKYKKELYSDFVINFIGELVVRENINRFAKILVSLSLHDYPTLVEQFEHKKFGMNILRESAVFTFHISLLQSILTESLKKTIT